MAFPIAPVAVRTSFVLLSPLAASAFLASALSLPLDDFVCAPSAGFVAFIFVVLSGKQLRLYLMRPEDYYDIPYTPRVDDHDHGHGHDDSHVWG